MAISINHQVMMMHHFKLTLNYEKNIEKAFEKVIPILPKQYQKQLKQVTEKLNQGYKVDDVLLIHSQLFHPFFIEAISLLKKHTYFDTILEYATRHLVLLQKRDQLRKKVTRYPKILALFIGMTLIGFILFLLPFIRRMYQNFKVNPSALMLTIDRLMTWFQMYLFHLSILFIIALIGIIYTYTQKNMRRMIYKIIHHRFHGLKRFQLVFYIRFFTFMHLMLLDKRPLFDVFKQLNHQFKHTIFEKDFIHIQQDLEVGKSLSESMSDSQLFHASISHLFQQSQSNEQIQSTSHMLSQYYYEELMIRDQQFYAALEPILISILSLFVGMIAWMIYEPLLHIYEGLL